MTSPTNPNLASQGHRWTPHGSTPAEPHIPASWTTEADGWGVLCDPVVHWDPEPVEPSGLVTGSWTDAGVRMAGPAHGHFFTPLLLVVVILGLVAALHLELNTDGGPVATALRTAGANLAATHGAPPPADGPDTQTVIPAEAPVPTPAPSEAPPAAPAHDAPAEGPTDAPQVIVPPAPSAPKAPPVPSADPGPAVIPPSRRAPAPTTPAPAEPARPPTRTERHIPGSTGDSSWDSR